VLAASAAVVAGAMVIVWLLSLKTRNTGIVDVFWGPGFALVALAAFPLGDGYTPRRVLVLALAAVWGLRLGAHLGIRNVGKPEDFRYARMRERSGGRWGIESLFKVFAVQAVAMWTVSLPLQFAQSAGPPERLTWRDALGVGLWALGFAFESIGDAQLRRFKADPSSAGAVMDRGLWRYTRHPNYFGDATLWWGFFVIALNSPDGWWTIVGPIMMTFVLARITGVPILERHLMRTRPGYEDYARRTSALFPLPPRR
jgi:steroid 5-alpha reductase family enzyme